MRVFPLRRINIDGYTWSGNTETKEIENVCWVTNDDAKYALAPDGSIAVGWRVVAVQHSVRWTTRDVPGADAAIPVMTARDRWVSAILVPLRRRGDVIESAQGVVHIVSRGGVTIRHRRGVVAAVAAAGPVVTRAVPELRLVAMGRLGLGCGRTVSPVAVVALAGREGVRSATIVRRIPLRLGRHSVIALDLPVRWHLLGCT